METQGAILADQIKSVDWKAREAVFIEKVPIPVVIKVCNKAKTLLA